MRLEDEARDTKQNDHDGNDGNDPGNIARSRILENHPHRAPPPNYLRLSELELFLIELLFGRNLVVWVVYAIEVKFLRPVARSTDCRNEKIVKRKLAIHIHSNQGNWVIESEGVGD